MTDEDHPILINLLGVSIHSLSVDELNAIVIKSIENGEKDIIANVNIHAMNIACREDWFKTFLNNAAINFCDGEGVRLGAKLKRMHIKEKITYNRWVWQLAEISERRGFSWYLLGSKASSLDNAVVILKEKYPKLQIAGHHHGYLNDQNTPLVLGEIKKASPDILILGMGMPLQERFLFDHFDALDFRIALTGGAVFDYISGDFKMTPDIFYKLKLEWLYRVIQQPKRLFKRYFIGIPEFFIRVLLYRSDSTN